MSAPTRTATLVYVYAVGRDVAALDAVARRSGAAGHGGAPLRVVESGGLGALVCDVPADRFGEEGLKRRLDDLAALEELARGHHGVVAAAFDAVTVLPMRLACVYADDAGVRGMLATEAGGFSALLDSLEGHREFGVKVYADPRSAGSPPSPARPEGAEGEGARRAGGPGMDYLRRRRAQRDGARRAYAEAEAMVQRVVERASAFATAHARHRPQQGALASGPGENVANLAFLVPRARQEAFTAAMEALGATRPGVRVEVTGPWAPYSFATAQDGAVDGP
ncbi:GvpL/GvpF family gas vesicle protein [Actinacidiphila sp. DG2A-62]|uniref:GvpL/GvpF family gas vesicle protein n=1 Tax=Actinacidiphila sp. DG2A-62 TaxID=3108821 RepID=UPI002DBA4692|nr:GvpL/GvpF family gas vesicle protein [Actinacidiphila sp. DG2A-62]MEC3992808.1 GvpL/GvpF family gas vesicle protein [Actinacidiphila sp. DG2A-62]